MIWITDETGQAVYFNRQWLVFTGQSADQALGRGWQDLVEPEDRPRVRDIYAEAEARHQGFDVDYRLRRQDGLYRWVVASATPRLDANGSFLGYIGSVLDITERKEAERKLQENADLLHRVFLEVPAIVALIRAADQVYILANPMYRRLHGDRVLVGKSIREANPDLEGQGFFQVIARVIQTGQPFVGKEVAVTIQNQAAPYTGYFNLVLQPLMTSGNQVTTVLLFAVEVTELVLSRAKLQVTNDELTRINQELRQTNTDLDNFMYTASHDLKAPIANLEGLIQDLRYTLQGRLDADEQKLVSLLSDSINKLKATIMDLTEITKVQKSLDEAGESLAFAAIYQDVVNDLQPLITESGARITTDFDMPEVYFVRKNLRSILYNLVSNALKYRAPDRALQISVATRLEGNFICLLVADNGLGIRTDQHHKLFTMFKRVHTHVEGSGIGLYLIKRIVENSGGYIELESAAGQGSTFKVYLPL
jgi:PAS domain S-box-containing protein